MNTPTTTHEAYFQVVYRMGETLVSRPRNARYQTSEEARRVALGTEALRIEYVEVTRDITWHRPALPGDGPDQEGTAR